MLTSSIPRRAHLVLAAILFGACASEPPDPNTDAAPDNQTSVTDSAVDVDVVLPTRNGQRRQTTGGVPHMQLDAEPVPEVDAELRRRIFQLPGVENRPSDRSLPGARGIALSNDLDLARPDVIAGSSEFAHIHPDGSLHVWLPVNRAVEVDEKKWGELHPWVDRDNFWDGVVMVFTPETSDELDIAIQILVDAYNFVTGSGVTPADIP